MTEINFYHSEKGEYYAAIHYNAERGQLMCFYPHGLLLCSKTCRRATCISALVA